MNIWNSIDSNLSSVFEMTWPMIVISCVILSSLRFSYLLKNKNEFVLHKELLQLFFIIYILCLFQVVTFQDVSNIGSNNFVPFKEISRYKFGSSYFIKNIIGNLIMFIPYGFFVKHYTKSKTIKECLALVLFASLVIEFTQLAIGRVFDVDDILLNVCGGSIGVFLYFLLDKIGNIYPRILKSRLFLDIITFIVFAVGVFFVFWR